MNNRLAFVYPPNSQKTIKHRQANRIFRKLDFTRGILERCQCCGKYLGQQSQSDCLCYDTSTELNFLGAGVPLLFCFLRKMIVVLLALLLIVIIHALLSNLLDSSCNNATITCSSSFLSLASVSNKLLDPQSLNVQIYLVLMMVLAWAAINQWSIYGMRKVEVEADLHLQSPSDFAILISGLPDNCCKLDIEAMVLRRAAQLSKEQKELTVNLKIREILLPGKLNKYFKEQKLLEDAFMEAVKAGENHFFRVVRPDPPKQVGNVAIVVFQQESSKDLFLRKSNCCRWTLSIFSNWGVELSEMIVKGQKVAIQRAPQPDDILWTNLGKTPREIAYSKVRTYLLGLGLLLINGFMQYWLTVWQVSQPKEQRFWISIVSSIVVNIANYFITLFLVWSTQRQGEFSATTENQALFIKIVYFQFFNSGIFYALANALALQFDTAALIQLFSNKVGILMIINAFSHPLCMLFIDLFELQTFPARFLYEHQLAYFTQRDCNEAYQLPDSQIPFKYAYVVRTLWLTFFFAPFVPLVALFSLAGLVLFYVTCKILFRHAYRIPKVRSHQINSAAITLSYALPLALSSGQLLLHIFLQGRIKQSNDEAFGNDAIVYLCLALSLLWIFVPWQEVNEKFFQFKEKTNQNYTKSSSKFEVTYEMTYPLYEGERILQRDSRFLRSKLGKVGDHVNVQDILKVLVGMPISSPCLPIFNILSGNLFSQPVLPSSERSLRSN